MQIIKVMVYNTVIHNFLKLYSIYSHYKITDFILCVIQYILVAYFIP